MVQKKQGRRTKIVATVGPACESTAVLRQMIKAGAAVFRLNFSHGTRQWHAEMLEKIRDAAEEENRPIAVMQDLQGPRIRTGELHSEYVELEANSSVTIESGDFEGTAERIATIYEDLAEDAEVGDRILLRDGFIELEVTEVNPPAVTCRVVEGGRLGPHEGMNLPDVDLSVSPPTEKDLEDLQFARDHHVDYVALSFVRRAEDIERLRQHMESENIGPIPIVAKIERPEAVEELDDILGVADGVMVARGDLGIEMPIETVPIVQKQIIRRANLHGVPVITATQMLESMIHQNRPTRAEATDVANAILDGTDAVMLSGETAIGDRPVVTIRVMARIAEKAEALEEVQCDFDELERDESDTAQQFALAQAARNVSTKINAEGIVAFTITGRTAQFVSQQRPSQPIYALTPEETTFRRMSLVWGVHPVLFSIFGNTDEMIERGEARLLELGMAEIGDTMVCIAGASTNTPGGTDMLKIHFLDGENPYLEET